MRYRENVGGKASIYETEAAVLESARDDRAGWRIRVGQSNADRQARKDVNLTRQGTARHLVLTRDQEDP